MFILLTQILVPPLFSCIFRRLPELWDSSSFFWNSDEQGTPPASAKRHHNDSGGARTLSLSNWYIRRSSTSNSQSCLVIHCSFWDSAICIVPHFVVLLVSSSSWTSSFFFFLLHSSVMDMGLRYLSSCEFFVVSNSSRDMEMILWPSFTKMETSMLGSWLDLDECSFLDVCLFFSVSIKWWWLVNLVVLDFDSWSSHIAWLIFLHQVHGCWWWWEMSIHRHGIQWHGLRWYLSHGDSWMLLEWCIWWFDVSLMM